MTVTRDERARRGRPGGRWRHVIPSVLSAVAALVSVVGWLALATTGDRQRGLSGSDPAGARACQHLGEWLRDGRPTHEFELIKAIGPDVAGARTAAIRAAVNGHADVPRSPGTTSDFDGYVLVDLRRLRAACRAAGVQLPPTSGHPWVPGP